MRFAFTDEQLLFRDAVRELLAKECPPEHVRAAWEQDRSHSPSLWAALAEMGVLGVAAPTSCGGMGLTVLDLVLLLEESGRAALPEPLVETAAVAVPLLADAPERDASGDLLERVVAGDALVGVSFDASLVADADECDAVIACGGDRVVLLERGQFEHVRQESVDGARRLFELRYDPSHGRVLADGEAATTLTARGFDRGALGAAAVLLGLADHLLQVTVDYVQERQQFGVPVGSFQAVKHHLADALLALEFARPAVYNAAYSIAHGTDTASRDVSMAKAAASDAARAVARRALQCHGAIAYTVEYDLHMWMKRVWALAGSWGDAAWHRARVAEHVLGPQRAD